MASCGLPRTCSIRPPRSLLRFIGSGGRSKSTSRNARQAYSCINEPFEIKVSSQALLRLACWCRQRLTASDHSEQGGSTCNLKFPPAPATSQPAETVPLEQLWTRLAPAKQHELLTHLSRMLAERLTPPTSEEEADE